MGTLSKGLLYMKERRSCPISNHFESGSLNITHNPINELKKKTHMS